ncbi:MAG: TIGR02147 family protein [Polyangiaceae bacterium]
MTEASSVHIFEYLDYRQFLRDLYARKNQQGAVFSHRAFSRRAGLRSTNYLNLVMKGERDLSNEMAPRFAKACGLVKREAEFFCDLVAYNQAKTTEDKQRCHERLARFRKFRQAHRLLDEQAAYHAHWYMPAVRELASLPAFRDDPAWVAAQLEPTISERQARDALDTLCRLGLLVRDERGKLRQAQALLTTGPGPLGHQVLVYHHAMIDLAKRALDSMPREERDISCLTLCVAESTLPILKQRIRELRQELLQLAELEPAPERVVQLNFQVFPLSRVAAVTANKRSQRAATRRNRGKVKS